MEKPGHRFSNTKLGLHFGSPLNRPPSDNVIADWRIIVNGPLRAPELRH